MISLLKLSSEDAAVVVPIVSQFGRVLPPDWCIADVAIHTIPGGKVGLTMTVASASGKPQGLEFYVGWAKGETPRSMTDDEVRAEFDRHLAHVTETHVSTSKAKGVAL